MANSFGFKGRNIKRERKAASDIEKFREVNEFRFTEPPVIVALVSTLMTLNYAGWLNACFLC